MASSTQVFHAGELYQRHVSLFLLGVQNKKGSLVQEKDNNGETILRLALERIVVREPTVRLLANAE